MLTLRSLLAAGVALLALAGFAPDASAQATRTWVSGVGDDANPCSRTAPCKTFAGAISKTAAAGEISVLDPGGFGAVTITKSMTIDGGGFVASVLASGTNGVVISGTDVVVVLRNIEINGGTTGLDGVRFLNGKSLLLDNVKIQQFQSTSAANGNGINFAPNAGPATLTVRNSVISQNGNGVNGFGILIKPTGPGSATALLEGVTSTQNRVGLRVEDNAKVTVRNSTFSSNINSGVQSQSAAQRAEISLEDVTTAHNGANGIKSEGANAFVRMSNTSVYGNATGLNPSLGGAIISFGNNRVDGNTSNGGPTGFANEI